MDIITYTERATVIFNPDGTVKGSEAHVFTGYIEEVNVPDAPGGKTLSFQVVKHDVRPVIAADFAAVLNEGTSLAADAAAKAVELAELSRQISDREATISALTRRAEAAEASVAEQAAKIEADAEACASIIRAKDDALIALRAQITEIQSQAGPEALLG